MKNYRYLYIFSGASCLIFALLLYSILRAVPPSFFSPLSLTTYVVDNIWTQSLPSFFHVLGFSLLTMGLVQANWMRFVPIFWLGVAWILEILQIRQLFFTPYLAGTFDYWDLLFAFVACICSYTFYYWFLPVGNGFSRRLQFLWLTPIIIVGALSSVATSQVCDSSLDSDCDYYYRPNATPVYMTYSELRQAVHTDDAVRIKKFGKIYRYNQLLLVSERNKGIHIWDNSDPQNPNKITFINIPGNVDLAVKDGFLYADSFIDLVVIDINNLNRIEEVNRVESVFPYNPYQVLPSWVNFLTIDSTQGVVIGYELFETP